MLPTRTPQSSPIPGMPDMVQNRAGGWAFEVGDRELLERFLVTGSVAGSYYADARSLTVPVLDCLDRLLESGEGPWVVQKIVEISEAGRAPKQDPGILALAITLLTAPDEATRTLAADAAPRVCRTVSTAASLAEAMRGLRPLPGAEGRRCAKPPVKGRAQRRAIAGCFASWAEIPSRLAYQLVKYRQRGGWSALDLARLSHFRSDDPDVDRLVSWLHGRRVDGLPAQVLAYEGVRRLAEVGGPDATEMIAELVRRWRLPWECVPTEYGAKAAVQRALFESMPMTALVRQLGRLTAAGVFESPDSLQDAVAHGSDVDGHRV
jgi:60 kDa SS-A/Ro ribonucleoprotein